MKTIEQSCQEWADKEVQKLREQVAGFVLALTPGYFILEAIIKAI